MTKNENNGLGIASMILGITGIFWSWIPLVGLPFCVLGLILGLVQKDWTKNGMAVTGVVLNSLFCGLQAIFILLMFIGIGTL